MKLFVDVVVVVVLQLAVCVLRLGKERGERVHEAATLALYNVPRGRGGSKVVISIYEKAQKYTFL